MGRDRPVEYRAQISTAPAELALLAEHDKMRSFDEVTQLVASLPTALDAATRDQVKRLLAMMIEEVTENDRVVGEIRLRPEAMAFIASPDPVLVWRPRTDSNRRRQP